MPRATTKQLLSMIENYKDKTGIQLELTTYTTYGGNSGKYGLDIVTPVNTRITLLDHVYTKGRLYNVIWILLRINLKLTELENINTFKCQKAECGKLAEMEGHNQNQIHCHWCGARFCIDCLGELKNGEDLRHFIGECEE